jgi:hypothetical protein
MPDKARGAQYEPFYALYTKMYPQLKDCYAELAKL